MLSNNQLSTIGSGVGPGEFRNAAVGSEPTETGRTGEVGGSTKYLATSFMYLGVFF